MGKVTIDETLQKMGLTPKVFCQALDLTKKKLKKHSIHVECRQTKGKKKKLYWEIVITLDKQPPAVSVGLPGYEKYGIERTVKNLLERSQDKNTKLLGAWPKKKKKPLLVWLREQRNATCLPGESKKQRKERRRKEQKAARALNLRPMALQRIENFAKSLPSAEKVQTVLDFVEQHCHLLTKAQKNKFYSNRKILSAYIAFLNTDFTPLAKSATEDDQKMISLWGASQELLVKIHIQNPVAYYQDIELHRRVILENHHHIRQLQGAIKEKQKQVKFQEKIAQLPQTVDQEIRDLQQQASQHWDKMYLLSELDQRFITQYGQEDFHIPQIPYDNPQQLQSWIEQARERIKQAFAGPSIQASPHRAILGLVSESPHFGVRTYAMWLSKSQAKNLEGKKLSKKYRHVLKDSTIVAIVAKIEKLIEQDLLVITHVGIHDLPVLRVTKAGKKFLQDSKHHKQPPKDKDPQAKSPASESHKKPDLLTAIYHGEKEAWLEFVRSDSHIRKLKEFDEEKISELRQVLDEKISGWQTLARWELAKHPRKYKPLERLLLETGN